MKKQINLYLSIGMIGFFIFGSYLISDIYQVFYSDKSIWWTPKQIMLTLDQTRDRFELWINGRLLQSRLEDGSLYALDSEGNQYHVVSKDIGVRINNWQSRQVLLLKSVVINAFIFGACMTLILVGIVQIIRQRKSRSPLPG